MSLLLPRQGRWKVAKGIQIALRYKPSKLKHNGEKVKAKVGKDGALTKAKAKAKAKAGRIL